MVRQNQEGHATRIRRRFDRAVAFLRWITGRQARVRGHSQQARIERKIALDRVRESAYQEYVGRITDLIEGSLGESHTEDEKRSMTRTMTLAALRQLDGRRKGLLLQFLYEAGLVGSLEAAGGAGKQAVVPLNGANLRGADLCGANLSGINLSRANLERSRLGGTFLRGADLSGANLSQANLHGADLTGANLCGANLGNAYLTRTNLIRADLSRADLHQAYLRGANLSGANLGETDLESARVMPQQLARAGSLRGATLPGGTKHTYASS
jgi:uncharacterized protein YjbI with pentapeptide repeats